MSKIIQGMLEFEQQYNKRREEKNKRIMCIVCHKEGHTMKSCYKLYPRDKTEEGRQDRRPRPSTKRSQGKKMLKCLQAVTSEGTSMSCEDESEAETSDVHETNLALMANYDEDSDVDMEKIILRNNITDKLAIDILREIAKARNKKGSRSRSSSTSSEVSLELNTNGYESECESTSGSSKTCDS